MARLYLSRWTRAKPRVSVAHSRRLPACAGADHADAPGFRPRRRRDSRRLPSRGVPPIVLRAWGIIFVMSTRQITENIELTTLPNGVRVVSEKVPYVQSASVGIFVGVGSRDEEDRVRGISHFIEHMMFKGTAKRTARQIADEIESRGGHLNAYTDKESTTYQARVLAEHTPLAMDILTDMLLSSLHDPEEIEREKRVVIEEIKMYEDTPEEMVHELFEETLWETHPLGKSIIGTETTVWRPEPGRPAGPYRHALSAGPDRRIRRRQYRSRRTGALCGTGARRIWTARPRRASCAAAASGKSQTSEPARHRADALLPWHRRLQQAGQGAVRALDPEQRAGRQYELAAVPGDSGEARPGLCHRLLRPLVSGWRPLLRLWRHQPGQLRRGAGPDAQRVREGAGRTV